jgi:hypothetical protein
MRHTCHWPNCREEVPPQLLMCLRHWQLLPQPIRTAVWAAYRPGQEVDKEPSRVYVAAVRVALDWAHDHDAGGRKHWAILG